MWIVATTLDNAAPDFPKKYVYKEHHFTAANSNMAHLKKTSRLETSDNKDS